MVPTVERDVRTGLVWSMAMAGGMPSMRSARRTVHAVQELAGVGGEGLDVAPLALGVDGIEGERRLAGAGDAGDDDQLAEREVEVELLEIVLADAAQADAVGMLWHSVAYPGFRDKPDMMPRAVRLRPLGLASRS